MEKEKQKKGSRSKAKGEIFYEAYPLAATFETHRVRESSFVVAGSLVENLTLWTLAVLELLLVIRVIASLVGATGADLFSFLIYALSYPLIAVFPFAQGRVEQIPLATSRLEIETLLVMAIYGIFAFMIIKIAKAFKDSIKADEHL